MDIYMDIEWYIYIINGDFNDMFFDSQQWRILGVFAGGLNGGFIEIPLKMEDLMGKSSINVRFPIDTIDYRRLFLPFYVLNL
jgi:hypothetical protein